MRLYIVFVITILLCSTGDALDCGNYRYAISRLSYSGRRLTCTYKRDHGDMCSKNEECLSNNCQEYYCFDKNILQNCDFIHPCELNYYCLAMGESKKGYCQHQHFAWTRCVSNIECLSGKCGFLWCY